MATELKQLLQDAEVLSAFGNDVVASLFEDGRWQWCWGQESFYPETAAAIIELLTNNQLPF